ncbi:glycosyltransferase family 2 protein [Comamonas badia]|uniref:glycosyltransferase family 2 protein n=1 Tax=Comamonas badia TaxID=265291 RepID=UPI000A030FEA|nr:glycosyltransferase [Comamonas badia]
MQPLLSIIIPTYRRPTFLEKAITSAIYTTINDDIEILVVPNGQDGTWTKIANNFSNDTRVRWLPLQEANACAARNHGLRHAEGKYIRFLDDDDDLLPAAADQLELIETNDLDICSAPLLNKFSNNTSREFFKMPKTMDFVSLAFLSISAGFGLTQGSIFKKSLIQGISWREDTVLYDDYFWILDVAEIRELRWQPTHEPVATYVQHNGSRLSRVARNSTNSQAPVDAILRLHQHLRTSERLTPERTSAAAKALLTHAHSVFPASPFYLGSIIQQALAMDPLATPQHPFFTKHPKLARHLLASEWALLPTRYLTRSYRRAIWEIGKLVSPKNP